MASIDTIRRITIQAETRGLTEMAAELRKVESAQGDVARSSDGLTAATTATERKVASLASSWNSVANKADPFRREIQSLIRDMGLLERISSQKVSLGVSDADIARVTQQRVAMTSVAKEEIAAAGRVDAALQSYAERRKQRDLEVAEYEIALAQRRVNQVLRVNPADAAVTRTPEQQATQDEERVRQHLSSTLRAQEAEYAKLAQAAEQAAQEELAAASRVDAAMEQYAAKAQRRAQEQIAYEQKIAQARHQQESAEFGRRVDVATGVTRQPAPAGAMPTSAANSAFGDQARAQADEAKRATASLREQEVEYQRLKTAAREFTASLAPVAHMEGLVASKLKTLQEIGARGGIMKPEAVAEATKRLNQQLKDAERNFGKDGVGGAMQFASYQAANFGYQINDVISGIAMGQSPFTILTQQGGQFYQILSGAGQGQGIVGGLKSAGTWLANTLTVGRVAFGGLTAGALGLAYATNQEVKAAREFQTSLGGIGKASGATVKELMQISNAASSAGNISISAAQGMANEYIRTGKIGTENLGALIAKTKDYAATTGQDIPAAQKDLAAAFADPAKGIDTLAAAIGGVDAKTRNYVISLAQTGRVAQAQSEMLKILKQNTIDAASAAGPLSRAWDDFWKNVSKGVSIVGQRGAKAFVPDLDEQLAGLKEYRSQVEFIAKLTPWGRSNLADMDAQIAKMEEMNKKIKEQAVERANLSQEQTISIKASDAVRELEPLFGELDRLKKLQSELSEGIAAGGIHMDSAEFEAAQNRLQGVTDAINVYGEKSQLVTRSNERLTESFKLQAQAMSALTPAQAALIAQEQKRLELSTQVLEPSRRAIELQQALVGPLEQYRGSLAQQADQLNTTAAITSRYAAAVTDGRMSVAIASRETQAAVAASQAYRSAKELEAKASEEAAAGNEKEAAALRSQAAEMKRSGDAIAGATRAQFDANAAQAAAAQIQSMRMEAATIRASTAVIGTDVMTRNRVMEAMRAEQSIIEKGIPLYGKQAQEIRKLGATLGELKGNYEKAAAAHSILLGQTFDIQNAQLELSMLGASTAERVAATEALKAEQQIRAAGIPQYSAEADAIRRNARALGELKGALEEARQSMATLQQQGRDPANWQMPMHTQGGTTRASDWEQAKGGTFAVQPDTWQVEQANRLYGEGNYSFAARGGTGINGGRIRADVVPNRQAIQAENEKRAQARQAAELDALNKSISLTSNALQKWQSALSDAEGNFGDAEQKISEAKAKVEKAEADRQAKIQKYLAAGPSPTEPNADIYYDPIKRMAFAEQIAGTTDDLLQQQVKAAEAEAQAAKDAAQLAKDQIASLQAQEQQLSDASELMSAGVELSKQEVAGIIQLIGVVRNELPANIAASLDRTLGATVNTAAATVQQNQNLAGGGFKPASTSGALSGIAGVLSGSAYYQPTTTTSKAISGLGGLSSQFLGRARGGPIMGPGSGKSDDVLLWGSNGEFMVNSEATAKHRRLLEHINDNKPIPKYASGGPIESAYGQFMRRPSGATTPAAEAAAEAAASPRATRAGRGGNNIERMIVQLPRGTNPLVVMNKASRAQMARSTRRMARGV